MAMSDLMHARNLYKTAPDYTEIAIKYPAFRKVAHLGLDGKVFIHWKDTSALRELTVALLHKDFGLKVDIPPKTLIPTVPLRLNYILWLEDLVSNLNIENVSGVDVGCGASCIYPLIIARKNGWTMYGIEKNLDSMNFASKNIDQNKLSHLVNLFHQKNDVIFTDFIESCPETSNFTFSMCNPPFYDTCCSDTEPFANRSGRRKPPKSVKVGILDELSYEGGEFLFIKKMLTESAIYGSKISIFTTMVGHKTTIAKVEALFPDIGVRSYCRSQFCQGNTTRWGLAWTFKLDIQLR